jgi:hypothetical protein
MKLVYRFLVICAFGLLSGAYSGTQHDHGKLGDLHQVLSHPAVIIVLVLIFGVLMTFPPGRRKQQPEQRPSYGQQSPRRFAGRN